MNTTFPENLQRLRKAAGLSQEQLAERIGVSRQAISKWETGETAPEMGKLLQLCQVLSCGLDTLCFPTSEGKSAAAPAGAAREEDRRNILHLDDADPAAGRSAIEAAEGQRRHRATQVLAAEDPSVGEIRRSANEAAYAADARQFKTGI